MLKKSNRLTRKEVGEVIKNGKKAHGPLFSLVYVPAETFKATVVVSKKVSSGAAERNKLRRKVYSLLDEESVKKKPFHVMVVVKKRIKEVTFSNFSLSLLETMRESKLILVE